MIKKINVSSLLTSSFLCPLILSHSLHAQERSSNNPSINTSVPVAQRLFKRLTGMTLAPPDPRLSQMASMLSKGRLMDAAAIATKDPYFYQTTVKNLASELLSKTETPFTSLDDAQATFIGTVMDDLDARELLTGNYLYQNREQASSGDTPSRRNNGHFEKIDTNHFEYKSTLTKQEPQWSDLEKMNNHAGVLTTRGWGWNYDAGTNRRAVLNAFDRFLCRPIGSWKVPGLSETAIARDIDRSPGKNPKVFQQECRTCHGGLDPMRDAFSGMDFLSGALVELPSSRIAPKYSRGKETYPEGHITTSDEWFNPIAKYRTDLGFKMDQVRGKGIQSFGEMIANSESFSTCMAEKVYSRVCQKKINVDLIEDMDDIRKLSKNFRENGYQLKKLFENAATLPQCLDPENTGAKETGLSTGVRTFNEIYYALSQVTGVKPDHDIDAYYQSILTRLPKNGFIDEISPSMLMAEKGLASMFCKKMSVDNTLNRITLSELSFKAYGRASTPAEFKKIGELQNQLKDHDPVFVACVAVTSSLEFLVK